MAYLRDWDEQSNGWEEWGQVSPYESESDSSTLESSEEQSNEELALPDDDEALRDFVIRRAHAVFYRPPTHVWLYENLWPFLARRYGVGREWWNKFMDCLFWTPGMSGRGSRSALERDPCVTPS